MGDESGTRPPRRNPIGQNAFLITVEAGNAVFFSKVRKGFGGRARAFISGGAPLGIDLATWFADIGIVILQGYGLTETSPVIAINTPEANRLGTVGKKLPNVEVKIAEDGE